MDGEVLLRKALLIIFCTLGLTLTFLRAYLDYQFYYTRPTEANPVEGRVYLKKVHHGATVYLTKQEYLLIDSSFYLSVFFIIAAIFMHGYYKPFKSRDSS